MNYLDDNLTYQIEPETEIIGGKVVMMASPSTNHITIGFNLSRLLMTRAEPPHGSAFCVERR